MKIIDAVWEERNLGRKTIEIEVEDTDDINDWEKIDISNVQYVVCKIPSYMAEATKYFQEVGYTYIEDQIAMVHNLQEIERNALQQRMYNSISYRRMTNEDIKRLLQEIKNGMFYSDRVSVDSEFDAEMSANRYINWTNDLINNGALAYCMLYKDDPSGFILLKTSDGVEYESVLGGAYIKYRKTGLGAVQKEQEIVRNLGGKIVSTHVSSNNVNQLRALCLNGYLPNGIQHVFVLHK